MNQANRPKAPRTRKELLARIAALPDKFVVTHGGKWIRSTNGDVCPILALLRHEGYGNVSPAMWISDTWPAFYGVKKYPEWVGPFVGDADGHEKGRAHYRKQVEAVTILKGAPVTT
jgi:hypothetical protein